MAYPSCRLWLLIDLCTLSTFEPGAHGSFLMLPAARGQDEEATQARQAGSQPGLLPRPLHLLPQRIQTEPY